MSDFLPVKMAFLPIQEMQSKYPANWKLMRNLTAEVFQRPQFFNDPKNFILSDEQKRFYDVNGYLVIKKLVPDDILDNCRQRFLDICHGAERGQMTLMKEITMMNSNATGERLYNKVQDILHDDVFSTYTAYPPLLDYVQCFTGPNIMGMHSMLINKPPGTSIHPPHQDLHYFPFRPAEKIVASWTAMERVDKTNGCLYVIPGTHKGEHLVHSVPKGEGQDINKAYHGIHDPTVAPESKRVYVIMEKGDTVFFHPLLVHGSGPNHSEITRKAISCHYAACDCHYVETKGTIQEELATEIEKMGAKKGMNVNFQDIWALRGTCVRGIRSGL